MIVEIILMMDSGHVRNMCSALSNKLEKSISLDSIIRIYHDARSSECQISVRCNPLADLCWRVCIYISMCVRVQPECILSLPPSHTVGGSKNTNTLHIYRAA